jgi:NAD(P) transhydrogenase subunit alpha
MMKDNVVAIDWSDEVLAKTALTHGGALKSDAPKQGQPTTEARKVASSPKHAASPSRIGGAR